MSSESVGPPIGQPCQSPSPTIPSDKLDVIRHALSKQSLLINPSIQAIGTVIINGLTCVDALLDPIDKRIMRPISANVKRQSQLLSKCAECLVQAITYCCCEGETRLRQIEKDLLFGTMNAPPTRGQGPGAGGGSRSLEAPSPAPDEGTEEPESDDEPEHVQDVGAAGAKRPGNELPAAELLPPPREADGGEPMGPDKKGSDCCDKKVAVTIQQVFEGRVPPHDLKKLDAMVRRSKWMRRLQEESNEVFTISLWHWTGLIYRDPFAGIELEEEEAEE